MARRSFTFSFTGGLQTVTVSTDFDGGFQFDIRGGGGGQGYNGLSPFSTPGKGGRVTGTYVPAKAGDTIDVYVPGQGGTSGTGPVAGGYGYHAGGTGGSVGGADGGGGGGGGAVLDGAILLAVAGGGGGGGGAPGTIGGFSGFTTSYGFGGAGGATAGNGAVGQMSNAGTAPGGGKGGTATTDGAAGSAGLQAGGNGGAGTVGAGGVGGNGGSGSTATAGGGAGGGGGGGLFGGGGGGGGGSSDSGGGGGGGCSVAPAATTASFFDKYQSGAGSAIVSWLVAPIATPSAPTGTISTTSTPLMTAAYSSVDGLAQQSYQVAVYATPGGGFPAGFNPGTGYYPGDGGIPLVAIWNSGVVYSSGPGVSIVPGVTIPNGNMTAWFQFTDAAGADSIGSAWASSAWVQATPGPTAPTLTVVPSQATARATLTIVDTSPPASGTLGLTYYHIQRSVDGVNWAEILGGSWVQNPGNLLSPDDASFEGSIGNMSWVRTGGTGSASYSASQALQGSHSLSEAGNAAAWQLTSQQYAVQASAQYAAMLGVRASSTTTAVALLLNWYADDGVTLISTTVLSSGSATSGGWTVLSGVTFSPANAAYVTLGASVSSGGGALFFDGNGLWEAAVVPAWSIGGGSVMFADRAAPREVDVFYRVQGVFAAGGNVLTGAWSTTAETYILHDGNDWLFSASDPALDGVVNYTGPNIGSTSHEDQQAYYPEGRADPVVFHGTIHDDQFVTGIGSTMFTFQFADDAQWQTFTAIRALQEPCLLKTVYGDAAGAVQFWMVIGPDVSTTMYGGGSHQASGTGRGPQIRTVMCATYVCAEPA